MQCNICPLYSSWDNEGDSGEACALFGDGWDSQFQYERNNQIWGCYIEKAYINKTQEKKEKKSRIELRNEKGAETGRAMLEEIRKELNFSSLHYHRLDDMIEAIGIQPCKLCTYCWNGRE